MYVFFIKVTQLSVLRYCENHTILFHWVCERAFQAKKVPSTNLNSHQKIGYHKYYTCQLALLRVICLKIKNVDHMHTRQFCMHNWQFKTTCSVTSEKRVNRLHCISPRIMYITGQIWFWVNFDLTSVDSRFSLFPGPNSWIIRARRQRK